MNNVSEAVLALNPSHFAIKKMLIPIAVHNSAL
jgi:hypothetical protein